MEVSQPNTGSKVHFLKYYDLGGGKSSSDMPSTWEAKVERSL